MVQFSEETKVSTVMNQRYPQLLLTYAFNRSASPRSLKSPESPFISESYHALEGLSELILFVRTSFLTSVLKWLPSFHSLSRYEQSNKSTIIIITSVANDLTGYTYSEPKPTLFKYAPSPADLKSGRTSTNYNLQALLPSRINIQRNTTNDTIRRIVLL